MIPPVTATANDVRLKGVLERIIFLNEENAYTIAEFRLEEDDRKVTITGNLPGVQCGETLELTGSWTRHRQHGDQFRIAAFKSELPASVYGIRKYLGSGLVPGIGPVYAERIVDVFGADTFRVLSEESARLREVPGIGRTRVAAIKAAWDSQKALREIMIFLQTYGVGAAQCVRIYKTFGPESPDVVRQAPYRLAREVDGIGFKTADRIAINLGFANDSPARLDAGILYALETLEEEGHTAAPESEFQGYAADLLQTSGDHIRTRLDALIKGRALVRHAGSNTETILQLPGSSRAEDKIAETVRRLQRSVSGLPSIKVDAAVEWAQERAGFTFGSLQENALKLALRNKFAILTGGPGTGKTTILRALVAILRAKKARVHLAAPTGRAAQRLAETTRGFAQTIHRLLKFDPAKARFTVNQDHPLATDFLIVDEASMLDTRLAASLLQAVPARAHLLLVGDVDQLPSVGAGNVLQDLIRSGHIPAIRLEIIYRQSEQSRIVTTAHAVNHGDAALPPIADLARADAWSDLVFLPSGSGEDCVESVLDLITRVIPRIEPRIDRLTDIQVLAPMHRGPAGVSTLNERLQATLNPGDKPAVGGLRAGDKVIQLRNNYDKAVFNGDIGRVASVNAARGAITVEFDGKPVIYERGEFNELGLAYAISIHKSQGSEFPVVVVPLLKQHYMMLQRNLLYTAITRGRRRVFLVGEAAAYSMAVRNSESKIRRTHLLAKMKDRRRDGAAMTKPE